MERKFVNMGVLSLLLVTLMVPLPWLEVSAQPSEERLQAGPFVDRIWLTLVPGYTAVEALSSGDVDVVDCVLKSEWAEELQEAENIDIETVAENGYGCLAIKTDKYPLNITDFRRAFAFALDKERICTDVLHGWGRPLDSVVPACSPFSIEGSLDYSYYAAEVDYGNSLLDSAGFLDVNDDGFREAPDGSVFNIIVGCGQWIESAIEVGKIAVEALQDLDIAARADPLDMIPYLDRLYMHQDFDMLFLEQSFADLDVDWLAYQYWSEYAYRPYCNVPCWQNATYDSWRDELLNTTTYEMAYEAAAQMQRIWIHACPMVVCYEALRPFAHRTDRFEGFVMDTLEGVGGCWSAQKVRLKPSAGGPMGGTINWGVDGENVFNLMMDPSSSKGHALNSLLWDTLLRRGPSGGTIPWLAQNYRVETHGDNSAVSEGHTRLTFELVHNATWSDGSELTAEDVAFTLNYYREGFENPYGSDLEQMVAAYALPSYRVVVQFGSESFWHLRSVAYKPILPAHVFSSFDPDAWSTWSPDPFNETMVTSGPFSWTSVLDKDLYEMRANPMHFYHPSQSASNTNTTSTGTHTSSTNTTNTGMPTNWPSVNPLSASITIGSIAVIVGVLYRWRRERR